MSNFCQVWDEEAACSYNSLPCACVDQNHWHCASSCRCMECCEDSSNNQSSASAYNTNCCCCENCQHFHNNEYSEQNGFTSNTYSSNSYEYDLNKPEYLQVYEQESQYLYGNCDFQVRRNIPVDPFLERVQPRKYKNKYDAHYDKNIHRNDASESINSNVRSIHDQRCNVTHLSRNNGEITETSLNCDIRVTKSKSDCKVNNKSSTSDTITKDTFYSCATCDSNQVQMMYQNNKQGLSKSTINQSSMQTIASKASKPTVKRTILENKRRSKVLNSGYFEFISPTHSPSRDIVEETPAKLSKQHCLSTPINSSNNGIRYGYFEMKEKNYAENCKHQSKKVSFSELDRIPTKISKEVDTSHLKQSIMVDKCLSANIKHNVIKTLDKSLSANLITKEWMMSMSEILRILNKVSKQQLSNKRKGKVLESISTKSLTYFKPVHSNKLSITKQKNSISSIRKLINSKSLSEGSIKIEKNSSKKLLSKKENSDTRRENGVGYKSYLDKALDKLEVQISNKIEQALFTYADMSNKKQQDNIYNNVDENSVKVVPNSEAMFKQDSRQNEIGTNPSFTMQTLEDVIDSEEVEIDTNDLEERSSLSSYSNSNENKMYNSDVSSHNTEKTSTGYILEIGEKSQENETSIQSKQLPNNSTIKEFKTRNSKVLVKRNNMYNEEPTCKFAIFSPNNHQKHSLKGQQNSKEKFGSRKKLTNSKIREPNNSVASSNQEGSDDSSYCLCEHVRQKNASRKKCSSNAGFNTRNQHSILSHKQGCDSKVRGNRNKNIKFNQMSLGTIEEESQSCSNIIQQNKESEPSSETALVDNKESLKDLWGECVEVNMPNSISSIDIQDSSLTKNLKGSQRTALKCNDNSRSLFDQTYSHSDYLKPLNAYSGPGYHVGMNLRDNDSCCVRQTCRDCPKKRYYAKVLQDGRIQRYNENQNVDQLYEYMLDVPLFKDNYRHIKNRYHPENKQMRLLNMISFIMFIIMFYGIFQYINASIHNGRFPWI